MGHTTSRSRSKKLQGGEQVWFEYHDDERLDKLEIKSVVLISRNKKHAVKIFTARHQWLSCIKYYDTDTKVLVVPTTMTSVDQLKVVAAYCNDKSWRDLLPTSVPAMMWLYKHVVYFGLKDNKFELDLVRRVLGSVVAHFEASDQQTRQRAKQENSKLIADLERDFGTCFADLTDVQKLAIGYILQMSTMGPAASLMIPSFDYNVLVGRQFAFSREDCNILAVGLGVVCQRHQGYRIDDMFDQSLFTYIAQPVKHGVFHLFLNNKGAVYDLGSVVSHYSRFSVCGKYLFVLKEALAEDEFEVLHVTVDKFACKKLSEFAASDNQQDVDVGRLLSSTRRFVRSGAVTKNEVFPVNRERPTVKSRQCVLRQ